MKDLVKITLIFLIPLLIVNPAIAKTINNGKTEKTIYKTQRITGPAPTIDGRITESIWDKVEWSGDFTQREPYEGEKPSEKTAFKILYNEKNLYIAIRAFDSEPDKIDKRMSRRDRSGGDNVGISIDSYFDKRTAFSFAVTAGGVKSDDVISNNGDRWDDSWNPIWYVKTSVDKKGWIAEMQIPLSQLRFARKDDHIWGLQVSRRLFRKSEKSVWQFIPKDAPGWVHLFGELHGIQGIKGKRAMELLPYLVGKYEAFEKEEGNPFATGRNWGLNVGIDGKIGISSDLTLDFTINPDFGQVEADPSELNLTTFETYFREKRPFFIEGKNILSFQAMSGNGPMAGDNLFYSRRIGQSPHYYPETEDNEYMKFPNSTKILGAFKLTGKTRKGLSVAILESVTARESAQIDFLGQRRSEVVEPFTNYFALRLQKDFRNGDTRLGGMFTATNRNIDNDQLNFLHTQAYTGGIDFNHSWKNKTYYINIKTLFSHVKGSPEAILETQESSLRYYQRPDADYVTLDPSRTTLSGHGGTISLGKGGSGHLRYSGGITWRSPGLELNDMGYLRRSDLIMQWLWVGYRVWKPFSIFREFRVNFNQYQGWDFGGNQTFRGGNINLNTQFKNYWWFSSGAERETEAKSNNELRGGPSILLPGGWNNWISIHSDSRKKLTYELFMFNYWGDQGALRTKRIGFEINYRPSDTLSISLDPSIGWTTRKLQYVDTPYLGDNARYLFAKIDQTTVAITMRLDFSITPDLTIQFYGQPYISAGAYSAYKRITNPMASSYQDRYNTFTHNQVVYNNEDETVSFDENGDGVGDYSVEKPDFNFLEFRSNLVLRWEYKPGSTFYLVWSNGRSDYYSNGTFSFKNDFRDLLNLPSQNVFLIKFTYMFNL